MAAAALREDLNALELGATVHASETCSRYLPAPRVSLIREPISHFISLFMELKHAARTARLHILAAPRACRN